MPQQKEEQLAPLRQIARIWKWVHLSEINEKGKLHQPDVSLPDGGLYLMELTTIKSIGENNYMVTILENCDLVFGPVSEKGFTKAYTDEEKKALPNIRKEFWTDMVYLKHALLSRTIILEDLPRK